MEFSIEKTSEFEDWFDSEPDKIQGLIRARFSRIELAGHFGITRALGDGLFELKWKSGLRVYFAYLARTKIIVLCGGTKNDQKKCIKKAKSFLS